MATMLQTRTIPAPDDEIMVPFGPGAGSDADRLPERFDVAVVGGGLAGLVAAATATRAGRSAVLFEQAGETGGRARTRVDDGYAFNIGPHALYRKMEGLRVLRELGVVPNTAVPKLNGSGLVKDGRLYGLSAGIRSLLTNPLRGWRAKVEAVQFFGGVGKLDPQTLEGLTVQAWLDQAVRSPSVRQLMALAIRTASYVDDPTQLSAAAGLRQLNIASSGALYVHGGWQTMVSDLRARAEALGVRIVRGARVADVELGEATPTPGAPFVSDGSSGARAVQAVRLADGRRYEVGAVILAVPPRKASALVDGGRQAALARWAEQAVPVRAATLDVGLRRVPRPDSWFALGLDRPLYLSVHSRWARLAPEGSGLVHVMRYLGPSPSAGADDERELEGLLDLVQPGWRDQVVARRFMPEITVSGATPSVEWEQREGPRGPAVPGTDGLFVAGDWVGPDGMLADRAIQSGARAGEAAAHRPSLAGAGHAPEAAVLLASGGA